MTGIPSSRIRAASQQCWFSQTRAEGQESRYYLILAQDLGYGDTAQLATALEEVSRLPSAYAVAILTSSASGSHIPQKDIKGEALG